MNRNGKQVLNRNNWKIFALSEVTLPDKSGGVAQIILLFNFLPAVQTLQKKTTMNRNIIFLRYAELLRHYSIMKPVDYSNRANQESLLKKLSF